MDRTSVITYVLLFFFFVLPAILKRRKKRNAAVKDGKKSAFGRLGEALQRMASEMEAQALAAKRAGSKGRWSRPDTGDETDEVPVPKPPTDVARKPSAPIRQKAKAAEVRPVPGASEGPPALPGRSLRQAVVWSEILGPPVSLR